LTDAVEKLSMTEEKEEKLDSLAPVYSVMGKYGVTCSPEEFHAAVNIRYHNFESRVYDTIHDSMWKSLPQQVQLLFSDYMETGPDPGKNLVLLDVGCGTGLASDLVLRTELGARVSEVDLLDPSPKMLQKASTRAKKWNSKVNLISGNVDVLVQNERKYNIIVVSSVLHHIPNLKEFLIAIRRIQAPSGIFIHMQDPNGDYLKDPELEQRTAALNAHEQERSSEGLRKFIPSHLLRRFKRMIGAMRGEDYIFEVNDQLIAAGIIQKPMTPMDMWTVTDIHVHDGKGISIEGLTQLLSGHRLISRRSYAFFGKLLSELPISFREKEQGLIEKRALNGLEVSALWEAIE
jgi:ubiquinone/menaquinone biosynthesis C-methylase UbiE